MTFSSGFGHHGMNMNQTSPAQVRNNNNNNMQAASVGKFSLNWAYLIKLKDLQRKFHAKLTSFFYCRNLVAT